MKKETKPQPVMQEILYQKAIGERIWLFVGELGGKYVSKKTEKEIQQVIVRHPETGDVKILNLPTANILRIQPKRMI